MSTISAVYMPRECFLPNEKDPPRWQVTEQAGSAIFVRHAYRLPNLFDDAASAVSVAVRDEVLERHEWRDGELTIYVYAARRDEADAEGQLRVASAVVDAFARLLRGRLVALPPAARFGPNSGRAIGEHAAFRAATLRRGN